jgi:hypothetical protein
MSRTGQIIEVVGEEWTNLLQIVLRSPHPAPILYTNTISSVWPTASIEESGEKHSPVTTKFCVGFGIRDLGFGIWNGMDVEIMDESRTGKVFENRIKRKQKKV